jgi:hypothetical protein
MSRLGRNIPIRLFYASRLHLVCLCLESTPVAVIQTHPYAPHDVSMSISCQQHRHFSLRAHFVSVPRLCQPRRVVGTKLQGSRLPSQAIYSLNGRCRHEATVGFRSGRVIRSKIYSTAMRGRSIAVPLGIPVTTFQGFDIL